MTFPAKAEPQSRGVAGLIVDGMDEPSAETEGPEEDDGEGGDTVAAESAFSDFAAAVKSGKAAEGVSALRELLQLVKE